ncbi:MAG TPA: hypothetical protein VFV22_03180 [Candidatus Paceibacterota bacterium]|nr:hypothetical protein [Candidatus Paceibacterota bacterium]
MSKAQDDPQKRGRMSEHGFKLILRQVYPSDSGGYQLVAIQQTSTSNRTRNSDINQIDFIVKFQALPEMKKFVCLFQIKSSDSGASMFETQYAHKIKRGLCVLSMNQPSEVLHWQILSYVEWVYRENIDTQGLLRKSCQSKSRMLTNGRFQRRTSNALWKKRKRELRA